MKATVPAIVITSQQTDNLLTIFIRFFNIYASLSVTISFVNRYIFRYSLLSPKNYRLKVLKMLNSPYQAFFQFDLRLPSQPLFGKCYIRLPLEWIILRQGLEDNL